MIRISTSPTAFEALAQTLPLGSVAYEKELDERGECHVWLEPNVVARLKALRGPARAIPTSSCGSRRKAPHGAFLRQGGDGAPPPLPTTLKRRGSEKSGAARGRLPIRASHGAFSANPEEVPPRPRRCVTSTCRRRLYLAAAAGGAKMTPDQIAEALCPREWNRGDDATLVGEAFVDAIRPL